MISCGGIGGLSDFTSTGGGVGLLMVTSQSMHLPPCFSSIRKTTSSHPLSGQNTEYNKNDVTWEK